MITQPEKNHFVFLTLLYFAMSLLGILHHELWLDEAHHWLLAKNSHSFVELLHNMQHEGHPLIWNSILFLVTRITDNLFWMQFIHIVLSTITVSIFLRKSPFSILFKVLFVFGYFMLFEYNIISRNYIAGVLFIFLALSIYNERKENFPFYCLYLVIAANIHLMFTVISLALLVTFCYENKRRLLRYYLGYIIILLGFFFILIQLLPSLDSLFIVRTQEIPLQEKFTKGFISLFKGLITIPDFRTIHFWNSNLLINYSKTASAIIGLLLYALPLLLFYKRKTTLVFTYTALFGVQCFFFFTQLGATRFDGVTYIIIITALWIDHYYPRQTVYSTIQLVFIKRTAIYFLLALQFISGVAAYIYDYRKPFSSGKMVASFIAKNQVSDLEIVTLFCEGTIIAPYLERQPFFLCTNSYQSFCEWETPCDTDISNDRLISLLADHSQKHRDFLFITRRNLLEMPTDAIKIRQLTKLDTCIVRNTDYYIFKITNSDIEKSKPHEKTIARF